MKKIKLETVMISLFLLLSLTLFGWFNITKPRILILHSYDKSYAWVRDVNIGLNRVLSSKYLYQVRWYYMDTKRHPFPDYKTSAGISARKVIDDMKPDVLIALDDDAQEYAARYYIDHPHMQVVFSGVNNDIHDYGFDKAGNVTGILERLPLTAISETLLIAGNFKTLTRPLRIAYLADQSETTNGDVKQIRGFNWAPIQLAEVAQVGTWPEWQAKVKQLDTQVDAILVTGYRRLSRSSTDKTLVPAKEIVAWTEANSAVPVISGNGFYAEEGGMLAIGTSPYEQGEVAAEKALQIILGGKTASQIPIATSTQFIVTMSGSKMKLRNFSLPSVYEAAARTGDKYFP